MRQFYRSTLYVIFSSMCHYVMGEKRYDANEFCMQNEEITP